jgi:LCP family protein required for cell wall assembly
MSDDRWYPNDPYGQQQPWAGGGEDRGVDDGGGVGGNGVGGGRAPRSRRRRIVKWVSITMAVVLVVVIGFGVYVYETTVANVKHTALLPSGVTQATLPDGSRNILLIGSDTRDTAADCNLGGDCGTGANADSEIILHVAANGSNATVMSIPRDTVTTLPQCSTDSSGNVTVTGSHQGQINSALQGGPECQVAADHDLTGITITGYIMFDFDGVVSVSSALGGVPVCVTAAVNDKNSGLQLPAGVSLVKGNTALEFLRTRDSFFDGSDLGREETTHYFFTQMIQSLRGQSGIGGAATLLSVAQALSSSTTVSNNLASLPTLLSLADTLNGIPSDAITFVTMPWEYDPSNDNRVIANQPAANQMFQNIQNDVSYTSGSSSAAGGGAVPQAPAVNKADIPVSVYNANGVGGRAGTVASALSADGFTKASAVGDLSNVTTTEVYYPSGDSAQADAVAAALKVPGAQVQQSSTYSAVTVVIGTDFEAGTTYTPVVTAGNTAGAATAPSESFEQNADSKGECIPVESGSLAIAHQ